MVAGGYPVLWNDDRNTLYELLNGLDTELGGLYRRMIELISTPPIPGQEKSRLALIGHCFRELINTLPDALRDVPGFPVNRGKSDERERHALISEYEAFFGSALEQGTVAEVDEDGQPVLQTVPQSLVNAMYNMVKAVKDGETRNLQRDSVIILRRIDIRDPALRPWRKARKFFMDYVHFDRNYPPSPARRALPSEEEILSHLENAEAALHNRLGAFFDNLDKLEDILAKANETIDEDESP